VDFPLWSSPIGAAAAPMGKVVTPACLEK
jgi:hypothetical protein